MKVFIEELGEWFDPNDAGVMLVLTEREKKQIGNMPPDHERYLQVPRDYSQVRTNQLLNIPPPLDDTTGLNGFDITSIEPRDDD